MHIFHSAVQKVFDWFVQDSHEIFFSYLQWSMRISFLKIWFIQYSVRWLMSDCGINKNTDYDLNKKAKLQLWRWDPFIILFIRRYKLLQEATVGDTDSPCWNHQHAIRYGVYWAICSLFWPTSLLLGKTKQNKNLCCAFIYWTQKDHYMLQQSVLFLAQHNPPSPLSLS